MQPIAKKIWLEKYALPGVDVTPEDTMLRVAKALAEVEPEEKDYWAKMFYDAMLKGAIPAGRIMSNAGAESYKPRTALINCTVSSRIQDSMEGIADAWKQGALILKAGCGIGYNFSTLRPKGASVAGAGARTSGPLPFMNVFDAMCATIASAGDRRGAQMGTLDIWHPDIMDFIKAKRKDGVLRNFNLSVLVSDDFMTSVATDSMWQLVFPVRPSDPKPTKSVGKVLPAFMNQGYLELDGLVICKVYSEVPARQLWDAIMESTYKYAEPGVLFIDTINQMNNNWFCEYITATNPCGEQPLFYNGACLLGSIDVSRFISPTGDFDLSSLDNVARFFTRMLDNVVEIANLPLPELTAELVSKRRHGMGITGYGTLLNKLDIEYGSDRAIELLDAILSTIVHAGWDAGICLAQVKGPAPLLVAVQARKDFLASAYLKRTLTNTQIAGIHQHGCRFTHHTSIAPTGTISLSFGNNCSSGIEPTFMHKAARNFVDPTDNIKKMEYTFSAEFWDHCIANGLDPEKANVPSHFQCVKDVSIQAHIRTLAAAQKWVDSAISKTINVPTETSYADFKGIYTKAWESGCKGCTTYRPNPEGIGEILVDPSELAKQRYQFTLETGEVVDVRGDEIVDYHGSKVTGANLYHALKEKLL